MEQVSHGRGWDERERENPRRVRETEKEREAGFMLTGSRAQAQEPQDHDLSQSQMLNQLSHRSAPVRFCLCKTPRVIKFIETEIRMVDVRS